MYGVLVGTKESKLRKEWALAWEKRATVPCSLCLTSQ